MSPSIERQEAESQGLSELKQEDQVAPIDRKTRDRSLKAVKGGGEGGGQQPMPSIDF